MWSGRSSSTFRRNVLPPSSRYMVEAGHSSCTLINIYQTPRHHKSEDSILHISWVFIGFHISYPSESFTVSDYRASHQNTLRSTPCIQISCVPVATSLAPFTIRIEEVHCVSSGLSKQMSRCVAITVEPLRTVIALVMHIAFSVKLSVMLNNTPC
jgi:hypothetical protein